MSDETTYAEATITLRLSNLGTWGDECTAGQIRDQATEAALRMIRQMLLDKADIKPIEGPVVTMISSRRPKTA